MNELWWMCETKEVLIIDQRLFSGSGKSTVLSLLLRLYDPDEGAVYFGGMDIKTLNPKWLRSNIGFVPQVCENFATRSSVVQSRDQQGLFGTVAAGHGLFQSDCRARLCQAVAGVVVFCRSKSFDRALFRCLAGCPSVFLDCV